MTVKEILEKEVFNVNDISILFEVSKDKAYKVIREIRSFSDRLKFSGKCHRKDYEDYLNRETKKDAAFTPMNSAASLHKRENC